MTLQLHDNSIISIDWLRLAVPYKYLQAVSSLLSVFPSDFSNGSSYYHRKFVAYFADSCAIHSDYLPAPDVDYISLMDGRVLEFNSDPEKYDGNFFVDFSGSGLGGYFSSISELIKFIQDFCQQFEASCMRFDVAIDDKIGALDIEKIYRWSIKGDPKLVTKWKQYHYLSSGRIGDNSPADTLYLGNKRAHVFCRIYDKKALHNWKAQRTNTEQIQGHWHRCEFQYNKKRANEIFQAFAEVPHSHTLIQRCLHYLDFQVAKDKDRTVRAKWWQNLIGTATAQQVRLPKPDPTLEQMQQWVIHQASATIALLEKKYGRQFIKKLLREGNLKLQYDKKKLNLLQHGH